MGIERALRRVARFADGRQTHSLRPEVSAQHWDTIRRYARQEERNPDRPGTCLYHAINVDEGHEAAIAETKRFLDLYEITDSPRPRIEVGQSVESLRASVAPVWSASRSGR